MDFRNFIDNIDPRMRRIALRSFIALAVLSLFFWISGSSFIQIDLENNIDGEETTYTISNGKDTFNLKDKSNSIRRFVRSGRYEIEINQADRGFFAIVDVGGFFQTTVIKAKLQQESERVFTGTNPSPCTTYYNKKLYSYTCNGDLNDLRLHVPATSKSPTYTSTKGVVSPDSGLLINLRSMHGKLVGLVRSQTGGKANWKYKLYIIGEDLKTISSKTVPELKGSQIYMVANYLDGAIIYKQDLREAYYLQSYSSRLSKVNFSSSTGSSELHPQIFSSNNDGKIVIVKSNNTEGQTSSLEGAQDPTEASLETEDEHEHNDITSEITYLKQDKLISSFELKGSQIIDADPCGKNNICILSKDLLTIYSKDGTNVAEIKDVDSITSRGEMIIFANKRSVVEFSPETLIGQVIYSIGSANFCGINQDLDTYTVCLIKNDEKLALTIFPDTHVSDLIDRRVFRLAELAEIKNLSINNNYIHISSNFVPWVYDPSTNTYGPDKIKREKVRNIILSRAVQVGISSKYKIVISP